MTPNSHISLNNFADIMGVSRATVDKWIAKGKYTVHMDISRQKHLLVSELQPFEEISAMLNSNWEDECDVVPRRVFTSVELFAGGGGLALGMHEAGFKHLMLNEFDKDACDTLRTNMPDWNVVQGDIHDIDFTPYADIIDFLSGGFLCQAFSYAGKRLGFEETRGTLFFELARAVKEIKPKVFMAENVKGLLEHDNGRTIETIKSVINELGYTLIEPRVLRAILYNMPQKRERLILIAIRNDLADIANFEWPSVCCDLRTLRDAFYSGAIYDCDVPKSDGQQYPKAKKQVMELVPEGGDWRDLPPEIAKEYMKGSYYLGGGKTGMARRLSMDEASLTLTCAPAQKQTERCHPKETRPLTVREFVRIQTFPDEWRFCGSLSAQYKQIDNAVPVNLAWAVGRSIIRLLNQLDVKAPQQSTTPQPNKHYPTMKMHGIFEGMACDKQEIYQKGQKSS